jgi:hypothetical protein
MILRVPPYSGCATVAVGEVVGEVVGDAVGVVVALPQLANNVPTVIIRTTAKISIFFTLKYNLLFLLDSPN